MDGVEDIQRTLTITFDPPITFGDKSASEVNLREPTADEYDQAAGRPGFGLARHLMVLVGKLPAPIAAKLPISKVVQADAFFGQFIRPALPPAPAEPQPPQEGDAELFDDLLRQIKAKVLREPTLAELDAAGVGMMQTAKLVAFTTGMPVETARRMPISVSAAADAYFAGFTLPARETGSS